MIAVDFYSNIGEIIEDLYLEIELLPIATQALQLAVFLKEIVSILIKLPILQVSMIISLKR